jgi:probable F420-dependent oxidoreductase
VSLPIPPDVETCLERALWGEAEGFDAVWFADVGTVDALTLAAAIAVKTSRIQVGLGVVPAYTRTPAVFASTVMTLSHLAPGRIVMGLGASSHGMIEGWHGIPFEKPLTRVRETVQVLRGMLAGEREDFQGETLRTSGYRLLPPLKGAVPIYVAALRAKMLEMAGEYGDGIVLNSYPLEALPRMLEHVAVGAARAGKRLEEMEIVCRHHVIVSDDVPAAREQFRKRFAAYFATPVYNDFLAWCGFPEAAGVIAEGWKEKDRAKTSGALDDALVDKLGVLGGPDHCRDVIREHIKLGITTPVINPISDDPAVIAATYEAFAPGRFSV